MPATEEFVWPLWAWAGFVGFIVLLLLFDLGLFSRQSGRLRTRQALYLTASYIALALLFAGGLVWTTDADTALAFLTGFVLEKSLSFDNIFVFVVLFQAFGVPPQHQHRVLFWGVLGALVMRGLFIAAGATLLRYYDWIILVFGALLVVSGVRLLRRGGFVMRDPKRGRVYGFVMRHLNVTDEFHGSKFFVRKNGALVATPLLVTLVIVESTDAAFAIDSIPAIFSVTRDPFIVFTSNVFALLGLRALYFAVHDVIEPMRYLKPAAALLLVVIGIKIFASEFVHVPVWMTLGATLAVITGGIGLSLLWRPGAAHGGAQGEGDGNSGGHHRNEE